MTFAFTSNHLALWNSLNVSLFRKLFWVVKRNLLASLSTVFQKQQRCEYKRKINALTVRSVLLCLFKGIRGIASSILLCGSVSGANKQTQSFSFRICDILDMPQKKRNICLLLKVRAHSVIIASLVPVVSEYLCLMHSLIRGGLIWQQPKRALRGNLIGNKPTELPRGQWAIAPSRSSIPSCRWLFLFSLRWCLRRHLEWMWWGSWSRREASDGAALSSAFRWVLIVYLPAGDKRPSNLSFTVWPFSFSFLSCCISFIY